VGAAAEQAQKCSIEPDPAFQAAGLSKRRGASEVPRPERPRAAHHQPLSAAEARQQPHLQLLPRAVQVRD